MKILRKTLIIALCAITMLGFSGCGQKKKSLTSEQFQSKMKTAGFTVEDAKYQFASNNEISECYIAAEKNLNYKIEFYVLDSSSSAQDMFTTNKNKFEKLKDSSNSNLESSVSMSNYAKYTLQVNGKYKVVSRIDNTLIYIDTSADYKDDIIDVLKDLGY